MRRSILAAASLCLLATPPLAAETCGWLPTSQVDAALPAFAPWSVLVGGAAGSCKFIAGPGANVFGANQMVKSSADHAAGFVRGMRPEMEKSYIVAPAKELGAEAFTYRPKSTPLDERSIFFVGHEGRVAVIASLSLAVPLTPEHIAAATKLVRVALSIDKDPRALAAATACPWFADDVIRKLLPGERFSQQSFGGNSCMAQESGSVVMVTAVTAQDPGSLAQLGAGGCTSEPVAALGTEATIAFACKDGRPNAKVSFVLGDQLVQYSFAPEPAREPTKEERALLVELALRATGRSN